MNNSRAAVEKYKKLYAELRFERSALFELIREKYHPTEVLYPGCSIHITPAFFFLHICFVDRNPDAVEFFFGLDRHICKEDVGSLLPP